MHDFCNKNHRGRGGFNALKPTTKFVIANICQVTTWALTVPPLFPTRLSGEGVSPVNICEYGPVVWGSCGGEKGWTQGNLGNPQAEFVLRKSEGLSYWRAESWALEGFALFTCFLQCWEVKRGSWLRSDRSHECPPCLTSSSYQQALSRARPTEFNPSRLSEQRCRTRGTFDL